MRKTRSAVKFIVRHTRLTTPQLTKDKNEVAFEAAKKLQRRERRLATTRVISAMYTSAGRMREGVAVVNGVVQ